MKSSVFAGKLFISHSILSISFYHAYEKYKNSAKRFVIYSGLRAVESGLTPLMK